MVQQKRYLAASDGGNLPGEIQVSGNNGVASLCSVWTNKNKPCIRLNGLHHNITDLGRVRQGPARSTEGGKMSDQADNLQGTIRELEGINDRLCTEVAELKIRLDESRRNNYTPYYVPYQPYQPYVPYVPYGPYAYYVCTGNS